MSLWLVTGFQLSDLCNPINEDIYGCYMATVSLNKNNLIKLMMFFLEKDLFELWWWPHHLLYTDGNEVVSLVHKINFCYHNETNEITYRFGQKVWDIFFTLKLLTICNGTSGCYRTEMVWGCYRGTNNTSSK